MVEIQTISILFAGLSICLAAFYYINILKSNNEARQRELMYLRFQYNDLEYMETFTYVMSKPIKTHEEFREHFDPIEKPEAFAKYIFLGTRYQNLGLMLQEGKIDADLLFKIFTPRTIMQIWEKILPHESETRKRFNDPDHYSAFEYLYNEAKKRHPEIQPKQYGFSTQIQ
jgi:hypothetical protein